MTYSQYLQTPFKDLPARFQACYMESLLPRLKEKNLDMFNRLKNALKEYKDILEKK